MEYISGFILGGLLGFGIALPLTFFYVNYRLRSLATDIATDISGKARLFAVEKAKEAVASEAVKRVKKRWFSK